MYPTSQNPLTDQEIVLKNRTDLHITGVKKLESLNSNEFFFETTLGKMHVRGHELEMKNLDLERKCSPSRARLIRSSISQNKGRRKQRAF